MEHCILIDNNIEIYEVERSQVEAVSPYLGWNNTTDFQYAENSYNLFKVALVTRKPDQSFYDSLNATISEIITTTGQVLPPCYITMNGNDIALNEHLVIQFARENGHDLTTYFGRLACQKDIQMCFLREEHYKF